MRIAVLTTGGTIEKRYDEAAGALRNHESAIGEIMEGLRLVDFAYDHVPVMFKDSLEMSNADRQLILEAVKAALPAHDAVLVVHGTDTLALTGDVLHAGLHDLDKPVILTGAMRPYQFRDTDAFQNVTEALLACRLVAPGVYVVMHNNVLQFPGVLKDRVKGTFVKR